jgi:two-component system, LuxR family, response regulator FixJ
MNQVDSQYAWAVMSSPAQPTIYVVDDDAGVLGSLRFLLETEGFAVRTFRSGAALLNTPGSADADCFVIDYKMPDINGIDLVGRLRDRDITAPAILITGYPDGKISVRARRMPASSMCCRSLSWTRAWSSTSARRSRKAPQTARSRSDLRDST